jgi:hypothetical protein
VKRSVAVFFIIAPLSVFSLVPSAPVPQLHNNITKKTAANLFMGKTPLWFFVFYRLFIGAIGFIGKQTS